MTVLTENARLTEAGALELLRNSDIHTLGARADAVKKQRWGNRVFYSAYLNLNYTNFCENDCKICSFQRRPGSDGGYLMDLGDIERRVRDARRALQIREIHIVGGAYKEIPFSYYLEMIERIRRIDPSLIIKAFTAVEIAMMARAESKTHGEILDQLKRAGVTGLPGGGAEIFAERVRRLICPAKISGEEWLEIHRAAHRAGLVSNATMLYGHFETDEEIVDHLKRLRDLQDETGGFRAFIPLAFHPANTVFKSELTGPTGLRSIKIFTLARIYLDNFPHIKAHWPSFGPKFSQVLFSYGADDIGGTAVDEKIFRDAGDRVSPAFGQKEIEALIRETVRRPQIVDASYYA